MHKLSEQIWNQFEYNQEKKATAAQLSRSGKTNIFAKTATIMTLGNSPMVQTMKITDEDRECAEYLQDVPGRLFTSSTEQRIINLLQESEKLKFKQLPEHLYEFHDI